MKMFTAAVMAMLTLSMLSLDARSQSGRRSGMEVVDTVCAACHATGKNGAPKIGDQQAWAGRTAQGLTALTRSEEHMSVR